MSYIAVLMILFALSSNILLHNGSMRFARIQIFMFAGLLPVSIYIFNQLSFVSFIANSVAIPMLGSIVLPVLFLALIYIGQGMYLSWAWCYLIFYGLALTACRHTR